MAPFGKFEDQGGLFSYISPDRRVRTPRLPRGLRRLQIQTYPGYTLSASGLSSNHQEVVLAKQLSLIRSPDAPQQCEKCGLAPDDPVWDPTTFTKNRDRLEKGEVFAKFMAKLLNHPEVKPLLSDEHFSMDGTLIEAWASHKSFRPKDGSGDDDDGANFHGQKRKNDTHASVTDPNSRLYRKAAGREAKLCYMGHVIMENRNRLAVDGRVTHATGTAERRASEDMLEAKVRKSGRRITVVEDKAYDTADHVAKLRALNVTPHVAQYNSGNPSGRQSAIDGRTTPHDGYGMLQSCRAMAECIFGWGKQHGTMRKTKHRGLARVAGDFLLNLIAYNLVRIPKLIAA